MKHDRRRVIKTGDRRVWGWGLGVIALIVTSTVASSAVAAELPPVPEKSYIVSVRDGVEPLTVAGDVGAQMSYRYDSALTGFAASLTPAQLDRLHVDTRVLGVVEDGVSRSPRSPGRKLPPGHGPQLTSWGQDRMGLLESPTARVDGKDKPKDRVDADVAVLDGGVNSSHIDLNVAGGFDCLGEGSYEDLDGHGTMVSGFIGALDNAYGFVGVAPGARIWAIRVALPDGDIPDSALLCGLDWVAKNSRTIDVANLSLGDFGVDTGQCGAQRPGVEADPFHKAICRIVKRGVTVVAAAGNESMDAAGLIPAAYPEVIAVSAFTETDGLVGGAGPPSRCNPGELDDHLATFSNYGATVDIAAPGECVSSTWYDGYYAAWSGTSFAAPHVSGAAALVRARYPTASPERVRNIILRAAAHDALLGDPDGIPEPILDLRKL